MVFQYLYIWDKEEEKVKAIHSAQVQSWPYPERQLSLKCRGWTQRAPRWGSRKIKLPVAQHKWSDRLTGGEGRESRSGIRGDNLRRMNVLLRRMKEDRKKPRLPGSSERGAEAAGRIWPGQQRGRPAEGSSYPDTENTTFTGQFSI